MTSATLKTLPSDYAATLGNLVLHAQALQSTFEGTVNGLIGNVAAHVIVKGQSVDRLGPWGVAIAERQLPPPWPARLKIHAQEARRVLDLRNQVVHGSWRLGDNQELETVRWRRNGMKVEVMPLGRLRQLALDIRNVTVDLSVWGSNWQRAARGETLLGERIGDVRPDGSWRAS